MCTALLFPLLRYVSRKRARAGTVYERVHAENVEASTCDFAPSFDAEQPMNAVGVEWRGGEGKEETAAMVAVEEEEGKEGVGAEADVESVCSGDLESCESGHARSLRSTRHLTRLELRRGDEEHCWSPLPPEEFAVRAQSYLRDGKKAPSADGSQLLGVELFRAASPAYNVAGRLDSPLPQLLLRATRPLRAQVLVINNSELLCAVMIPATDGVYQLVFYIGVYTESHPTPAGRLLDRFINGSDAFRNARLKLIPSVAEGPWMVRKAVSPRPAILGKTLRQRYFRTDDYFECDIDCNSNPAAGRIVSLVKSYAKAIAVDLAFLVEAQTLDELPERLLGSVRIKCVDLETDGLVPQFEQ
ncbi:MAG: hypothetical protein SGPRY_002477 [Prymnesium sp.]